MRAQDGKSLWLAALVVLVVVGCVLLAFELGRYQSGFSLLDRQREQAEFADVLALERATSEELRRQLAIAATAASIDKETYDRVKANLGDLEAEIQSQEEELVFYRGIVSPKDGVAGLRIQSLEVLPGAAENEHLVRVLLAQAIVQSRRVAGLVKLRVEGVRDGQTASFDAAELLLPGRAYDMEYEFRYFQVLEAELVLPLGFEPERVIVDIWPNDARAERINQTFDWAVIAE